MPPNGAVRKHMLHSLSPPYDNMRAGSMLATLLVWFSLFRIACLSASSTGQLLAFKKNECLGYRTNEILQPIEYINIAMISGNSQENIGHFEL